jgi:hypothetical protein
MRVGFAPSLPDWKFCRLELPGFGWRTGLSSRPGGAFGWNLAEIDSLLRHGIPVISMVGNDPGTTQIAHEHLDTERQ